LITESAFQNTFDIETDDLSLLSKLPPRQQSTREGNIISIVDTANNGKLTLIAIATDTSGNEAQQVLTLNVLPQVDRPELTTIQTVDANVANNILDDLIEISFSEPMALSSLTAANIRLFDFNNGQPVTLGQIEIVNNGQKVIIHVPKTSTRQWYRLELNRLNLVDIDGNAWGDGIQFENLVFRPMGQVVIGGDA
jgi:hypothetical protein